MAAVEGVFLCDDDSLNFLDYQNSLANREEQIQRCSKRLSLCRDQGASEEPA